jgi:hypothetical protein
MKKKFKNKELTRLSQNKKVIEERVELLNSIVKDMEQSGGMPNIPLGGLFDDILLLNPFRGEKLIPILLAEYEQELEEVNLLMAKQN